MRQTIPARSARFVCPVVGAAIDALAYPRTNQMGNNQMANRIINKLRLACLCPVLALCCTVISFAQTTASAEPDFIVPARPTVSNPAEFQKPGVLQIEYGYNANFHAPG